MQPSQSAVWLMLVEAFMRRFAGLAWPCLPEDSRSEPGFLTSTHSMLGAPVWSCSLTCLCRASGAASSAAVTCLGSPHGRAAGIAPLGAPAACSDCARAKQRSRGPGSRVSSACAHNMKSSGRCRIACCRMNICGVVVLSSSDLTFAPPPSPNCPCADTYFMQLMRTLSDLPSTTSSCASDM